MPILLTADAPGLGIAFGPPQWGIFTPSGSTLLISNAVNNVDYARDYSVSDYPQEKGAFESYNKVQRPYHAKVGFLISSARREFLNNIEVAAASLDLVSVVTPEISYPSANITHYSFSRTSKGGVTLILVDVWLEEIRVANFVLSGNRSTNSQSGSGSSSTSSNPSTTSTPENLQDTQSNNGASPTQSGQIQTYDNLTDVDISKIPT